MHVQLPFIVVSSHRRQYCMLHEHSYSPTLNNTVRRHGPRRHHISSCPLQCVRICACTCLDESTRCILLIRCTLASSLLQHSLTAPSNLLQQVQVYHPNEPRQPPILITITNTLIPASLTRQDHHTPHNTPRTYPRRTHYENITITP